MPTRGGPPDGSLSEDRGVEEGQFGSMMKLATLRPIMTSDKTMDMIRKLMIGIGTIYKTHGAPAAH
jgi:hypothetical protein